MRPITKPVRVLLILGVVISLCTSISTFFFHPITNSSEIGICDDRNCLVMTKDRGMIGFGELIGYHTIRESENILGEAYGCDSLVITGGNEDLMDYLGEIDPGGTYTDLKGNTVLDLYYTDEVQSSREEIKESSQDDPVTIQVALFPPRDSYKDAAWGSCGLRIVVIDADLSQIYQNE